MEIVTEIEKIKNKFDSSYHHHPIFMYYNKKQYPVKVISISGNSVIIKSLSRHDKENRILTVIENSKLHVIRWMQSNKCGNLEFQDTVEQSS